ncbi:MAG: MFS transporter, partial [Acidobacteria bacterium]|nr:MFS transporter [Acidobacteriota bacterium]
FAPLLLVGLVLGIPTISDAFVFLSLQRALDMGASAFPLMYVATSLFTALCSVPMGRLADKSGRTVVLIGGYAVLAVVYAVLLVPSATFVTAALALALLGAYYAATDGVLTAMAAAVLPKKAAGSGLSYLATVTNVARLFASILFGLLWERIGIRPATSVFLVGLVVAIAAAAVVLPRARKPETVVA